jgi:hypothetical protein
MLTNKLKIWTKPGGSDQAVSFDLVAIAAGTVTLPASNKVIKNFYMVAGVDFAIAITSPKEGGTYILDVTKTIAGDVVATPPATSSPTTITLTGAVNSLFQLVITYDKFDDGAGATIYRYVVTTIAL